MTNIIRTLTTLILLSFGTYGTGAGELTKTTPFAAPGAYILYCGDYGGCDKPDQEAVPINFDLINQINLDVNRAVDPITDWELFGEEERIGPSVEGKNNRRLGDCDAYMIDKDILARKAGIPAKQLLFTFVGLQTDYLDQEALKPYLGTAAIFSHGEVSYLLHAVLIVQDPINNKYFILDMYEKEAVDWETYVQDGRRTILGIQDSSNPYTFWAVTYPGHPDWLAKQVSR